MLPGEDEFPDKCPDCEHELKLEVHMSGGGYYIGTWCDCGPFTRNSGYYPSHAAASKALREGGFERDTGFHG